MRLDATVFHPALMRDLPLRLAVGDIFRATWTADIHREWIEALLLNQPRRDRAAVERTRDRMDMATRDCLVAGHHGLIQSLRLPDPNDRHVLAAGIAGRCDAIVTQHLHDFPDQALAPHGIEAVHPDTFPQAHFGLEPSRFRAAVRKAPALEKSLLFGR